MGKKKEIRKLKETIHDLVVELENDLEECESSISECESSISECNNRISNCKYSIEQLYELADTESITNNSNQEDSDLFSDLPDFDADDFNIDNIFSSQNSDKFGFGNTPGSFGNSSFGNSSFGMCGTSELGNNQNYNYDNNSNKDTKEQKCKKFNIHVLSTVVIIFTIIYKCIKLTMNRVNKK